MEADQRAALPLGDALGAQGVVPRHVAGSAPPLKAGADVVGGHAVQHGFDAVAIASTYSNPFVVWQMEVSSIIGIQRLISVILVLQTCLHNLQGV